MLWKINNKVRAVIFDMDGVISDTQQVHAISEVSILRDYGIELEAEEISRKYAGVTDREMFQEIFTNFDKKDINLDMVIEKKWKNMMDVVKGRVTEINGLKVLIERLKANELPLAVASASRISFIELVLAELKLRDKFDVITSSEEVDDGKPDPAVFLLTAKKLSIPPENCVVIEDGVSGMIAAKKTGMKCIGLVDDISKDYPADILVKNLQDIFNRDVY